MKKKISIEIWWYVYLKKGIYKFYVWKVFEENLVIYERFDFIKWLWRLCIYNLYVYLGF